MQQAQVLMQMQKEAHEFMIKQTIIMECIQKG